MIGLGAIIRVCKSFFIITKTSEFFFLRCCGQRYEDEPMGVPETVYAAETFMCPCCVLCNWERARVLCQSNALHIPPVFGKEELLWPVDSVRVG